MPSIDWLVTELYVQGGAEMFVRRMAARLRAAGWDIRVVTLLGGGSLVGELRADGVPVVELTTSKRELPWVFIRLYRLWRCDPPALIHTHLYHAGIVGRVFARWLRLAPVVVHQHGPEYQRSQLRTLVERLTAAWVTQYVVTCRAVAEILQQREHIASARIAVIYNGLEVNSVVGTRPAAWPVPPETPTLGCVGRLSAEKGQLLLLEALARLESAPHCVFIGTGALRAELEQRCAALGIGARVHFVGLRNDVADWLSCFDVFVLPSAWEGVSLALLEAMSAGLPVVATAVGGTPEVVVNGVTGLLVPPGDADALAYALDTLLRDPARQRIMGAAGQQRIYEHFSVEATTRQLVELYETLLHQQKRG